MVALAILRRENVVGQAEKIARALARKMENVERILCSGGEERDVVTPRFGCKELPDRTNFHEFGGFSFNLFHTFEKLDRFGFTLGEAFFKIATETQVAAIKHEGIDVAPDFAQIRDEADFALECLHGGNGKIRANFRRTRWHR